MKLAKFFSCFTGYSFVIAFICNLIGCLIGVFIIYLSGAFVAGYLQCDILDFYIKWAQYAIILPFSIHFLQTGIFTKLGLPAFNKKYRLLNNFVKTRSLQYDEYSRLYKFFRNIPHYAVLNSFIYFGMIGLLLILAAYLEYEVFQNIDFASMEILITHISIATIVVILLKSIITYFVLADFLRSPKTAFEKQIIKNEGNIILEKKFGIWFKFLLLIVFIIISCLYSFAVFISDKYDLITASITGAVFLTLTFLLIIKIYCSIKKSLNEVNTMSFQLSQNGDAQLKRSSMDYEFESLQHNIIEASYFCSRGLISFENRIKELERELQEEEKLKQEMKLDAEKKFREERRLIKEIESREAELEALKNETDPLDIEISKIIKDALHLSETGHLDEAIEILEEAKGIYPQKPQIIFNLAKCLFQNKEYDYSDILLSSYIESDNENKNAFYLAGVIKYKKNDFDASLNFIEKALSLDAEFIDAMLVQGMINKKRGYYKEAEAIFKKITQIDEENRMALFQLYALDKTK